MRGAIYLIAIPIVILVLLALSRLSKHRLRRVQSLAPGQFVFLFQANLWFQNAVLKLRSDGVIDPETKTDSEAPVSGPRWASASTEGLSLWRGYSATPFITLDWSKIDSVARSQNTLPTTNASGRTSSWGIAVSVRGPGRLIHLFLEQPLAAKKSGFRSSVYVDSLVDELNRLRGVDKDAAPS